MNFKEKNWGRSLRTLLQVVVFAAAAAVLAAVTDWYELEFQGSLVYGVGAGGLAWVQNWLEDKRAGTRTDA